MSGFAPYWVASKASPAAGHVVSSVVADNETVNRLPDTLVHPTCVTVSAISLKSVYMSFLLTLTQE